ncbi:MAG: response regulator [Elusimicrobiales bacterium]|nr:response regulator [Elusimicrobiales bacterium]
MKILIVDDNADVRALIRVILEHRGHAVVGEAGDGAAGLKAFAELRPDVVLLDIIMPGKSGLEVLEQIRELDPAAKVIMVTAVEQDGINRRLLLLGAAGIIYKPFKEEDFDKALRAASPPREKAEPVSQTEGEALVTLAAGGLSLCMLRTSEASTWAWELCGIEVLAGRLADIPRLLDFGAASASVQVHVRESFPVTAALVFRAEDIHFISSCWVKGPLYDTASVKELEEGILIEIGNIILNALINPLINAAHKIGLPSVPMMVKGGPGAVAAALGGCVDPAADLRIVRASLAMRREGRVARAAVLALLPHHHS